MRERPQGVIYVSYAALPLTKRRSLAVERMEVRDRDLQGVIYALCARCRSPRDALLAVDKWSENTETFFWSLLFSGSSIFLVLSLLTLVWGLVSLSLSATNSLSLLTLLVFSSLSLKCCADGHESPRRRETRSTNSDLMQRLHAQ